MEKMKTYFKYKSEIMIDALGVVAFTVAYVLWRINDSAVNIAGTLASLLSLVLFLLVCVHFVHEWMLLWHGDKEKTVIYNRGNKRAVSLVIFAAFLVYDLFILSLIHFIRVAVFKDTTTFIEGLNLFLEIDSGYYLKIAEQWYVTSPEYIYYLVFYPAYPLLIRAFNLLFNNYLISATVISALCYAASATMLYQLLLLDYDHEGAMRGIKYLAILPAAFFLVIPMSESLFLLLSILAIYLARKDKWIWACLVGAFCAFTRSLGVLVLAPLAFMAITHIIRNPDNRRTWIIRLILTLIIPLGTCAYLLINYSLTGDAFTFSELEYEKWGQSMGLFFDTTAFQIDNGLADIQQPYFTSALGLWFPNVAYCFAALMLMVFAAKRIRAEYTLWFICYYVLAIGVTYLISAPRYLVVCLPIFPALVEITKNKKTDIIFTVLSVICSAYYMFAFAARWEVF